MFSIPLGIEVKKWSPFFVHYGDKLDPPLGGEMAHCRHCSEMKSNGENLRMHFYEKLEFWGTDHLFEILHIR